MADIITQDLDLSLSLPFITTTPTDINSHLSLPPPLLTHHDLTTDKIPSHHQSVNNSNGSFPEERNSATPVVSLLSIDQQQEKDYLSMRGGRRRKSGPTNGPNTVHNPQGFLTNGYVNPMNSYALGFHSQSYNPYGNNNYSSNNPEYHRSNGVDNKLNRNKTKGRVYDKRAYDYSSRSSLRTDSNSSASCVDENKNEDRPHANTNTPPPAPYSPMTPHLKMLHNTVSREFHNIARYATNYKPPYHHNNNNNNNDKTRATDSTRNFSSSNSSSSTNSTAFRPISPHSSVSQVHVTTSQSFVPQARRSRRSIRRSGPAGISEIGAGDAPLPNEDVCKKFETLKL